MPRGIDYFIGNTRYRNVGPVPFSEFEDPDEIRNPVHLERAAQNADLRRLAALADKAEFDASPERQRIEKIRQQQAEDYDLEYNAPRRIDMLAGLERRKKAVDDAAYFDPDAIRRRESEHRRKAELFDAQYGASARARERQAELGYAGRVDSEGIRSQSRVEQERIGQMGRVREQMLDPESNQVLPGNADKVDTIDDFILGGDTKPFPANRLRAFADTYFKGDLRAAEEQLALEGYHLSYGP